MFHNSPINRCWSFLQDCTASPVSDGCDTRQSSSRLHGGKYHAVLLTRHAPDSTGSEASPALSTFREWLFPNSHVYTSDSEVKRDLGTCPRGTTDIGMWSPPCDHILATLLSYFLVSLLTILLLIWRHLVTNPNSIPRQVLNSVSLEPDLSLWYNECFKTSRGKKALNTKTSR